MATLPPCSSRHIARASPAHRFTVDGSPTGRVEATVRANVRIERDASLVLELRKTAGTFDPLLTGWSADVVHLTAG